MVQEVELEMSLPIRDLKLMSQDLDSRMKGYYWDVFVKIFKATTHINIVIPKEFKSVTEQNCIQCIYGSKQGQIFVLNKSLIFLPRPILHLKYQDMIKVEFLRISKKCQNKGFDFKIFHKEGKTYLFTNINKEDSNQILRLFNENGIFLIAYKDNKEKQENGISDEDPDYDDEEDNEYEMDDFLTEDHQSIQDLSEEQEYGHHRRHFREPELIPLLNPHAEVIVEDLIN